MKTKSNIQYFFTIFFSSHLAYKVSILYFEKFMWYLCVWRILFESNRKKDYLRLCGVGVRLYGNRGWNARRFQKKLKKFGIPTIFEFFFLLWVVWWGVKLCKFNTQIEWLILFLLLLSNCLKKARWSLSHNSRGPR